MKQVNVVCDQCKAIMGSESAVIEKGFVRLYAVGDPNPHLLLKIPEHICSKKCMTAFIQENWINKMPEDKE